MAQDSQNQANAPQEELSPSTQRSADANQAAAEQTTGPNDPANESGPVNEAERRETR